MSAGAQRADEVAAIITDLWPHRMSNSAAVLIEKKYAALGLLVDLLNAQREWSEQTFGPAPRVEGITDHIESELAEVRENPTDVTEWIDIVILAFDGAWRAGHSSEAIVAALIAKYEKNRARSWPDWRDSDGLARIEHIKAEATR